MSDGAPSTSWQPSRRGWLLLVAVVVAAGWCVATAVLFLWPSTDPPSRADAIVALGGDPGQLRAHYAVGLAEAGYAPVVLVSLGGGGRALLGKRRRGESSSSSGRRSSGGAAAVVAAVAAAAPAPSSAAGAVPPRRTAAQQDQVSRESVPVSDSDDVADADVAPGRGRERGAAENVDGAGVHLLGLSFLNLFFLFLGKGR